MNETRKAIIELIEPYMDKTPDIKCIVEYLDGSKTLMFCELGGLCGTPIRYIGHYDITAVLKYIDLKLDFTLSLNNAGELVITTLFNTFVIPNKPLYLYNGQEEKELLQLLINIGKKK